jgi:hypothetical protein
MATPNLEEEARKATADAVAAAEKTSALADQLDEEAEEAAAVEAALAAAMAAGDTNSKTGGTNKTGFMIKYGTNGQKWLKRWFILEDGLLAYHSSEKNLDTKGKYQLNCCKILEDESHPTIPNQLVIEVVGPNARKFYMRMVPKMEDEVENWKAAIASWCMDSA